MLIIEDPIVDVKGRTAKAMYTQVHGTQFHS